MDACLTLTEVASAEVNERVVASTPRTGSFAEGKGHSSFAEAGAILSPRGVT